VPKNIDYKLLISLVVVAIVWGTTYLGIRIAVESIPPWYITSLRQGLAALIVFFFLIYKKQLVWIGWENFKIQAIAAVFMIVIANGFTTIAEKTLPSGLTSILSALTPLVVFTGSAIMGLQKPNFKGFIGVLLGFSGVVFIFSRWFRCHYRSKLQNRCFVFEYCHYGLVIWNGFYQKKHT